MSTSEARQANGADRVNHAVVHTRGRTASFQSGNPHGGRGGLPYACGAGPRADHHSCRSASIGSSRAALRAGKKPKITPTAPEKPNARSTTLGSNTKGMSTSGTAK